jgi:hypothetical protein
LERKPVTSKANDNRPKRVNIYDCAALFALGDSLKDEQGKAAKMNYGRAKEVSAQAREKFGLGKGQLDIAFVSIDPHSEAQRRFLDALRANGIEQEAIDYRHAFVASGAGERGERPVVSLSANISYLLGLLADRENAEVVVWSPNFDLCHPLMDFVDVRKGKAVVVYFRPFLDPRWAQSGLFESSPIKFYDLEDHAEELLGVDLKKIEEKTVRRGSGLRNV